MCPECGASCDEDDPCICGEVERYFKKREDLH
jgi:hypothetical protein